MQEIKAYAAVQYHGMDFNVMPLRYRSKRPALPEWKVRQTTRLSRLELQRLFRRDCELAIITGELEETGVNILHRLRLARGVRSLGRSSVERGRADPARLPRPLPTCTW